MYGSEDREWAILSLVLAYEICLLLELPCRLFVGRHGSGMP